MVSWVVEWMSRIQLFEQKLKWYMHHTYTLQRLHIMTLLLRQWPSKQILDLHWWFHVTGLFIGMPSFMSIKAWLWSAGKLTPIAHEAFFVGMSLAMITERWSVGAGILKPITLEWPFSDVYLPWVAFQPLFSLALKIANVAFEGFFVTVSSLMYNEVGLNLAGIIAKVTFEGFSVAVSSLMYNEAGLCLAGIIAFATLEWCFPSVSSFMFF